MALRTPAFNDAKTYGFEWLRYMLEANDLQEGVLGAGDMKVTAAAGGGRRVDIAAGAAFVKGDSGVAALGITQGLFVVVNDAAIANAVTLNTSDATNPRIDQICLRVRDSSDLATGADDSTFLVVTGTPTAGATLSNRNGALALPNDHVRLADVLVPAGSAATSAGNIADRRPWARGGYRRIVRNANAAAGNDYTVTSATFAAVDATNLAVTLECSGAPVWFRLHGRVGPASAADSKLTAIVDGVPVDNGGSTSDGPANYLKQGTDHTLAFDWEILPSAGRHVIQPAVASSSGTVVLRAQAAIPLQLVVQETVRQNGDNT